MAAERMQNVQQGLSLLLLGQTHAKARDTLLVVEGTRAAVLGAEEHGVQNLLHPPRIEAPCVQACPFLRSSGS